MFRIADPHDSYPHPVPVPVGGGRTERHACEAHFARLAARQAIVEPLFNALAGLGGEGGVAGALRTTRSVDPGTFRGAPRLHRGGIASDEGPAILRRGEGVFTPEQMAALGGARVPEVHVEIVNRGAPLREVEAPRRRLDADRLIVGIVVDDVASGGPIGRAIERTYGARPAVA